MEDVTSILNRYRECSRHLWNTYFADHVFSLPASDDVLDRFEEVDKLLFSSLVLAKVDRLASESDFGKKPLRFLRVVPVTEEVPILINRPSNDRNKYWDDPVNRVGASEAELLLIGYFDWNRYGYADLAYYLVRIASFSKHPHLNGRDALLLTSNARVFFDPGS